MNPKIVLVICPNLAWFVFQARARLTGPFRNIHRAGHQPHWIVDGVSYKYVASPDQMRGYRGVQVEFWGPPPPGHQNMDWLRVIQVATLP